MLAEFPLAALQPCHQLACSPSCPNSRSTCENSRSCGNICDAPKATLGRFLSLVERLRLKCSRLGQRRRPGTSNSLRPHGKNCKGAAEPMLPTSSQGPELWHRSIGVNLLRKAESRSRKVDIGRLLSKFLLESTPYAASHLEMPRSWKSE